MKPDYKKLAAALVLATATPCAQADDFGVWTSVAVEKDITATLSAEADLGMRVEQNVGQFARWDAGLGVQYKPVKYLSVGAGYSYMYDRKLQETKERYDKDNPTQWTGFNVNHGYWRSKHRLYLSAQGSFKAGRFKFSLREKYQYTRFAAKNGVKQDKWRYDMSTNFLPSGEIETVYVLRDGYPEQELDSKRAKDTHYLRSRLQVEYNIRHCPLTPFASVELSNTLTDGFSLDKTRYSVGVDWKVAKQHRLSLAYLYQSGADDDDDGNVHVIDVGYKFKF